MALIPAKTVELDLSDYGEGLRATLRYNYAWGSHKDFWDSKDEQKVRATLASWVTDWNFEDEAGPIPHTAEGMERVPSDLVRALLDKFWAAVAEKRKAAMPPLPDGGSAPTTEKGT